MNTHSSLSRIKTNGLKTYAVGLVCFLAGCLATAQLTHIRHVRADNARIFELRIYHALPGKLPGLESRFRDTTSKLLAKHNLNVIGYWTSENTSPALENTFIWVVAHASAEDAKKNWDAFRADPDFQQVIKAEQAEKLVDKVESTLMRPTDFSDLK